LTDTLLILRSKNHPAATSTPAALGPEDPFGVGRNLAFQDTAGFAAGHVAFAGKADIHRLAHAEIIVLTAGGLTLDTAQGRIPLGAGDAAVLPRGYSGTVSAEPGTSWVFTAMQSSFPGAQGAGAAPDAANAIRLDPGLDRPRSPGPAAEVLVSAAPECHSLNLFTDPSGMRAGVWDVSTPCERTFVPHRVHELMCFIEGNVTLTHASGIETIFNPGDAILVPRAAPYAWKNLGRVVKYYVVL
jgi:uncharacterized cupin superfamily protein